jgi:asparagine synthase (glutamine-hydrolysing)
MGVIFGIYNINDIEITKEDTSNMIEELKSYSFDTLDSWQDKQIYLGCGVQYNTPESCLEKLPKYYEESGLSITADAIIDNREELFEIFKIPKELWSKTTDSKLIIRAYEKWKEDSPRYLIGDFAFAIWDEKKKQLFCARDQVGKRTLYYYNTNNTFAFSTTINPLLSISNKSLNERWLTDFLALDGILHAVESEETAYKNIFQLPPACAMIIVTRGIFKNHYWKPLENIKELKLKTDEEYCEAFRKVFFEAVNCRVRSASGVAVMLSGGLDSSAIACVAAKKLALKNEKLKAFSSVPIKEYKNNLQKCFLPDESEYIKTIGDAYDNISINYCKSEDKNSYTDIDKFIDILEQPYKIFKNLFWYNNFAEKAARGGCKVLLNGQSGNSTISYGDFTAYAKTLFESGKFITLKKEIDALSKRVKMPRREIGKIILRAVTPYKIRKVINSKITNRNYDKFSGVMIKKELLKKWKVEERFDKAGYNQLTERYYDFYEDHKFMVDQMAFSHISAVETKISLANKITIRDPSRDKRVIEFCLSVPSEQFVNNGCERLLIRRALKDIMPDKIRMNTGKRGIQSADWLQRLKPCWKSIRRELEQLMQSDDELVKKYIDLEKVKDELKKTDEVLDENNEETLTRLFTTLIFYRFLINYK